MVSPWMENGNMLNFIIKEDLRPAELKRLLSETAQGLHYLHSQSIVHGDLRCSNILIDTGKHAQLADFGLSLMAEGTGITSNATRTTGSWRWNAPELFLDAVRNTQTDVYAFGCLCLEAFTRQHPFPDIAYDHQVVFAISRGRRLTRPSQLDLGASTIDSIWDLTDQCWDSDAARRPTAKQVSEVMVDMLRQSPLDEIATGTALVHPESVDFGWGADDILEIAMEYDPILFFTELDIQVKYVIVEAPLRLCITRSDAGKLIDFVCEILLHSFPPPNPTQKKHFIAVLTELIHHSRHLPAALCVRGIQRTPEYPRSGIWADIHKGLLQSRVVALKRYSDYHTTKKRFIHAMLVWKAAEHPHVLPLTGLDVGTFDPAVWTVTVTPWMNNGNLVEYIDRQRVGNAKIHRLLLEAAEALQYLHSESIVHGNLRGWYIYVDRWKHARLAGFDFAAIVGDGSPQRRTAQLACEWTAPEAFLPEFRQYTIASDVWSFACTCLEAFTLLAPFPNLDSEYEVIRHLTRGGKPERPAAPYVLRPHAELISDRLWRLLELCWATEPAMRPSMSFVVDALEDIGGDWIRVQDVVPRRSASVRGGIATPTS
ncbi:kinase-like protein [Punctularia strigosozonata HHB-11173 SS5]|uniref:kinase-like protein n=1 Tax=Punctularia strigosozonata (strain HHB-11173) TaxID=741275 RepID=UPI0004417189|nr:kinase-like protein [Punctularia strigosozonata HHB-11173 SS5]EIN07881.1 kinase-like protein [Punctularia strigosozonata HHB-11173 SS5]